MSAANTACGDADFGAVTVVLRDAGEVEDFVTSLRERLLVALHADGAVQVE